MSWVLEHSASQHSARLVLLSLANHANDENEAWCSVGTICKETLLSERAVQGALRKLIAIGEIAAAGTHRKYRTAIYRLPQSLHPAEFAPPQDMQGAKPKAKSAPEPKASGVTGSVVPEALDTRSKDAKASTKKAITVPDRWPYFLHKLQTADRRWNKVTIAACVKLAKETTPDAVSTALSFAATDDPPVLRTSAYGWLRGTAIGLAKAAAA